MIKDFDKSKVIYDYEVLTMTIERAQKLKDYLQELESVVVAFSGGVDSSFLAAAAYKALGDKAIAVTAVSETLSETEKMEARKTAAAIGIRHEELWISELEDPEFVANNGDRCYHCKHTRFSALSAWAQEHGYKWVVDGSNVDDLCDYRPGMKAVKELSGVCSPLLENGLGKEDIRSLSRVWGLPTWNKLSMPCLSSRIAYGERITPERLRQVEQAEEIIRKYVKGPVRVRHHGVLARIEVDAKLLGVLAIPEVAANINKEIIALGFKYVTFDLAGYKTGSLNQQLENI